MEVRGREYIAVVLYALSFIFIKMVLDYSADRLWQVIYQDIGRMSEWNANLSSIEV